MRRLGVRTRVVAASVLVLVVGLGAIGVGLNVLLTHRLSADADAVLRARADAQRATIDVQRGRLVVREGPQDEALDREAWVFARGEVLARPPAPAALQRQAASLEGVPKRELRNVPGEVRLLAEPVYGSGGHSRIATIVVGVSLAPYEETERFARLGTVAFAVFLLLAGALIAWRAVGAGLRPVARMAQAAEDYSEHDLSRRFELGPAHDEITGLGATLDGLLARLQAGMAHEQRLSAEIAHELRTPLSALRAEAELALLGAGNPPPVQEALRTVIAEADRMSAAIDALLSAARHVDAASATGELEEAVRAAAEAGESQARQRGIALEVARPIPRRRLAADAGFVAQALRPLIDNAIRHAGSRVVIGAEDGGSVVTVTIEDDGEGMAEDDLDRIFESGVQTSGGSGAGLGLALSRRLAQSIGGTVRAAPAARGARLVVELPAVSRGATQPPPAPDPEPPPPRSGPSS